MLIDTATVVDVLSAPRADLRKCVNPPHKEQAVCDERITDIREMPIEILHGRYGA